MASRKEDEKNERIIRGLLKLPENRRCINCNSLGPQYVCTNFWIFVCTNCSGIHREFTHRVKSISMAKFTLQEVKALQEGGNKCAKDIFFKGWDPQRQSLPDSSNVERLRTFIKHVYVERRYSGERNSEKPPRVKMGEKEDSYDGKRTDMFKGGYQSPPYEDIYEGRYSAGSSPGGRSDDRNYRYGYNERSPGYGQDRQSPARPGVINDWRREDRFANGRRSEDGRKSDGSQKDLDTSSPPIVRPVRELLGENAIPLRVNEPPKPNGSKSGDGLVQTQRTASSSSLASTNSNQTEVKWESSKSLIDFDTDPEPPSSAAPQAPKINVTPSVPQEATSSSDNNWASFDVPSQASQPSSNVNPLDSVLSELSIPAPVPTHTSGQPSVTGAPTLGPLGDLTMLPNGGKSPVGTVAQTAILQSTSGAPASVSYSSSSFFDAAAAATYGSTPTLPPTGAGSLIADVGRMPSMQHNQPSLYGVSSTQPTDQVTPKSDTAINNQTLNISLMQNAQGPPSTSTTQAPQLVSRPVEGVPSGVQSQTSSVEVKPSGRKELPEDLFMATYLPFPMAVPAWQPVPQQGMGFTMQYNNAMPMPAVQQPPRSLNPFDINDGPEPNQGSVFPSMASLQGALPNDSQQSGLLHTSSFGTPQVPTYSTAMLQAPSIPSSRPTGPYMDPMTSENMPFSSHQGLASSGNEGATLGSFNMDQQLLGGFSATTAPNPFPSGGGNPFG